MNIRYPIYEGVYRILTEQRYDSTKKGYGLIPGLHHDGTDRKPLYFSLGAYI